MTNLAKNTPRVLEDISKQVEVIEPAIPDNESKAETFARLCPLRVNNAMDKIRIVGNLANTAQYEFSDEQVAKIEAALLYSVQEIMNKFRKTKRDRNTFTL